MSESSNIRRVIAETGRVPTGYHLLQDTFPLQLLDKKYTVTEGAEGKELPVMKITGLFQEGDILNSNGRIYPMKNVLSPAVSSIQEDIKARAVVGEIDHPPVAKINIDRVSHLITKLWTEGKKVYGEAEILYKTPMGAMLRGLFEHKVRIGISSRGVGDIEIQEHKGEERYIVCEGYTLVTFDAVQEPSVKGAVLKKLNEGLEPRIRNIKKDKPIFSQETYQAALVKEINKFFGL